MAELQTDKEMCSICPHDIQEPKVLECKHIFCFKCLEDYINKTSKKDQFSCPLCRRDMTVPLSGVKAFLYKLSSVDSAKSEVPPCDVCDIVFSRFRCVDCEQYLCKSCQTTHNKLKACQDHVVVRLCETADQALALSGDNSGELREKPMVSVKDICPNHSDMNVDFHCKQCSVIVCSICFFSDHKGHKYSDLQDDKTRLNIRDELKHLNTEIQKHVQTLEYFYFRLNLKYREITDSVTVASEKIDQQVVKICSEVKRLGDSIKDNLKKNAAKELIKLIKDIHILTKDLKASMKYSVTVLGDNSIVQILDRLPEVRQEEKECSSRKLKIPDVPKISFKKCYINKYILKQQLGTIVNESEHIYGFNVRMACKGQYGYCPEFMFAGERWQVIVCYCRGSRTLQTRLGRLTRLGDFNYTIKLVNHTDDRQSVIQQCTGNVGIQIIDWGKLCDPVTGFLVKDIFTIQVIKIDLL